MPYLVVCVIMLMAVSVPSIVYAVSQDKQNQVNEIKNQIGDIDKQIKESQSKLNEINKDKSKTKNSIDLLLKEVNVLNDQIESYDKKISLLNKSINELNGKIEIIQTQVQLQKEDINEVKDALSERLRAMYMAGETSSIEILMSSDSFETFLTRIELVQSVSKHDRKLIDDLQDKVDELKDSEKSLRDNKIQIQADKDSVSAAKEQRMPKKRLLDSKITQFNREYNKLKDQSNQQLAIKRNLESQRNAFEAQIDYLLNGNMSTGTGSGSLIWPVPYSNCRISSPYGMRDLYHNGKPKLHAGIDITHANAGHTKGPFTLRVVAAASGVVRISLEGWNGGYGNYIVIDHGNGLSTRYGHLYTRYVSKGQRVSKGQQIGIMGNTGHSTGAHLHFEVRINDKPTNPVPKYVTIP